jgi:hypothetical protein
MKIGRFDIKHGDRVTFVPREPWTRVGGSCTGRANGLLMFPDHLVLDMGGRYGRPQVVQANDIVSVKPARARRTS